MFSFCRRWLNLWLIFIFAVCFLGVWYGNAVSFTQRLEEIWLDVEEFSNKKSISRYEMTRLLNAANCEDCIQSPDWMKQSYTKSFWNDFRAIDWKDFNDIDYLGAFWNKKSYYYCVAYIWDNWYMAWYPKTSTKCQWNFCWQDPITVSEAYQTLLNIIQDQIRQKYEIDWSSVKDWMNGLSKVKREIILNQINIESIKNADIKSTYAQTNDEFQAWLKYCMYNLRACNFQAFWKIWQAYWPISEAVEIPSCDTATTAPSSGTCIFFSGMPTLFARSACLRICFCSPWTGIKNFGRTIFIISFSSSCAACPETWMPRLFS